MAGDVRLEIFHNSGVVVEESPDVGRRDVGPQPREGNASPLDELVFAPVVPVILQESQSIVTE